MALGIFNAGGGNQTLSMKTRTGAVNMEAVVGMVLFAQWWFWHPNAYFLSMALTPAANAHVLFDDDFKVEGIGFFLVFFCGGGGAFLCVYFP